jgi:hypothetical protein
MVYSFLMKDIFVRGLSPVKIPESHGDIAGRCVGPIEARQKQPLRQRILTGPTVTLEYLSRTSKPARNLLTLAEVAVDLPSENPELVMALSAFARSFDAQEVLAPLSQQTAAFDQVLDASNQQIADLGLVPVSLAEITEVQRAKTR